MNQKRKRANMDGFRKMKGSWKIDIFWKRKESWQKLLFLSIVFSSVMILGILLSCPFASAESISEGIDGSGSDSSEGRGNEVNLYFFYGNGCPHCSRAETFLDEMSGKYPELNVVEREVYQNQENRELFVEFCSNAGRSMEGVPTFFINGKMIVGFNNEIGNQIEDKIIECIDQGCEDYAEGIDIDEKESASTSSSEDSDKNKIAEEQRTAEYSVSQNQDIYSIIGNAFLIIVGTIILYYLVVFLRNALAKKKSSDMINNSKKGGK